MAVPLSAQFCWAYDPAGPAPICYNRSIGCHPTCAKHMGFYKHENWVATFLDSGHLAHLEKDQRGHIYTHINLTFLHGRVKLCPADFARPVFQDPATAHNFAYFCFLLPKFRQQPLKREWNSVLWDATVRAYWTWRTGVVGTLRHPDQVNVQCAAALVHSFEDLQHFYAALRGVWAYVAPEHLATRPPYMPNHGPQAEPTDHFPLFEQLFTRTNSTYEAIATTPPQAVEAFLAAFADLPSFRATTAIIRNRWATEAKWVWDQRRRHFIRALKESVIAGAMHPRRIEHVINTYGLEALDA
jgi:hypothetical protein